jgi:putative component of membrane protein insertase Oxa1/YidC/SpoIIIJ protein YidD
MCPPSNLKKNYLIGIFIYIKNKLIKCHPQNKKFKQITTQKKKKRKRKNDTKKKKAK